MRKCSNRRRGFLDERSKIEDVFDLFNSSKMIVETDKYSIRISLMSTFVYVGVFSIHIMTKQIDIQLFTIS